MFFFLLSYNTLHLACAFLSSYTH